MAPSGVFTALVTPFKNDELDIVSFEKLVRTQVDGGVTGVVVCGTTGEVPVLSTDEFKELVSVTVESAQGLKVFVGVGSCDTKQAVEKVQIANSFKVDGMLAVTPYYNKPTQSGLMDYYGALASETDKEIMLYSIPSRTGIEIAIPTIEALKNKYDNINSLKEATTNCGRVDEMVRMFGQEFSVFSGDDSMTLPFMALGAVGVVSVMSNIAPRDMSNMVNLAYTGDFHTALTVYHTMSPIMRKLFIECNPLPAKFLLHKMGIIASAECRSPLGRLSQQSIDELTEAMRAYK